MPRDFLRSTARLSDCAHYRYSLERSWGSAAPLVFVLLNPSTATAATNDPTIRRCIGFAKREGAGGIAVANLFAYRAPDAAALKRETNPVGPSNIRALGEALELAAATRGFVVCAWGAHRSADPEAREFVRRAADYSVETLCLGFTKSGAPRHPLTVPTHFPLIPFTYEARS